MSSRQTKKASVFYASNGDGKQVSQKESELFEHAAALLDIIESEERRGLNNALHMYTQALLDHQSWAKQTKSQAWDCLRDAVVQAHHVWTKDAIQPINYSLINAAEDPTPFTNSQKSSKTLNTVADMLIAALTAWNTYKGPDLPFGPQEINAWFLLARRFVQEPFVNARSNLTSIDGQTPLSQHVSNGRKARLQAEVKTFKSKWAAATDADIFESIAKVKSHTTDKSPVLGFVEHEYAKLAAYIESALPEVPATVNLSQWELIAPEILTFERKLTLGELAETNHEAFQREIYPQDDVTNAWFAVWQSLLTIFGMLKRQHGILKTDIDPEGFGFELKFIDDRSGRFEQVERDGDMASHKAVEVLMKEYLEYVAKCRKNELQFPLLHEMSSGYPPEETFQMLAQFEKFPLWNSENFKACRRVAISLNELLGDGEHFQRWTTRSGITSFWVGSNATRHRSTQTTSSSGKVSQNSAEELLATYDDSIVDADGPNPILSAIGVQQYVGLDEVCQNTNNRHYVYYPAPETRLHERAQGLAIARDLSTPGIHSDGPLPSEAIDIPRTCLQLPVPIASLYGDAHNLQPGLIGRVAKAIRDYRRRHNVTFKPLPRLPDNYKKHPGGLRPKRDENMRIRKPARRPPQPLPLAPRKAYADKAKSEMPWEAKAAEAKRNYIPTKAEITREIVADELKKALAGIRLVKADDKTDIEMPDSLSSFTAPIESPTALPSQPNSKQASPKPPSYKSNHSSPENLYSTLQSVASVKPVGIMKSTASRATQTKSPHRNITFTDPPISPSPTKQGPITTPTKLPAASKRSTHKYPTPPPSVAHVTFDEVAYSELHSSGSEYESESDATSSSSITAYAFEAEGAAADGASPSEVSEEEEPIPIKLPTRQEYRNMTLVAMFDELLYRGWGKKDIVKKREVMVKMLLESDKKGLVGRGTNGSHTGTPTRKPMKKWYQ